MLTAALLIGTGGGCCHGSGGGGGGFKTAGLGGFPDLCRGINIELSNQWYGNRANQEKYGHPGRNPASPGGDKWWTRNMDAFLEGDLADDGHIHWQQPRVDGFDLVGSSGAAGGGGHNTNSEGSVESTPPLATNCVAVLETAGGVLTCT